MKSKFRLFLLLFVLMVLPVETWGQRVMSDEILKKYESYQHPKIKFKFAKKQYLNQLKELTVFPIDTNAVYVSGRFDTYQNDTLYAYYRFFENGDVFLSHEYKNFPTETECNDLIYGKWGMYAIKGDELIMEMYVRGFPSVYWYNFAKVDEDKLKFYKRIVGKHHKHTESINFVKYKKQVKLINFRIESEMWKD